MRRLVLIALLGACGAEDTPGQRIEGTLSYASATPGQRSWTRADGWTVALDEAMVQLGPIYLRPPKRTFAALTLPRAHAHAPTLVDGEVMGESLTQRGFDVLGAESPPDLLASESGTLDRISVALDATDARGYQAFMRGVASRGEQRIAFSCGMRIEAMAQETPKNLEARRRVDNIAIRAELAAGAHLRVLLHPERWFDFVSLPDFVGPENPCARDGSAFALQWYLGLRRPEAFSAELF